MRRWPDSSSGSPATTAPDGGREDVHAAHVEHVVRAAGDAEPPRRPAAGARAGAGDRDGVAAPVAHERLAVAARGACRRARRVDPSRDRQPLERARVDDLGEHDVAGMEVQVGRLLALRAEDRQHLRQAEVGVAHRKAPGVLEAAPEVGVVEPRLAAEQRDAQAEVARLQVGLLAEHLREQRRIRRRARDGVHAEVADHLDQPARVADAERHDGRAGRLEDQVVREAARPHLVVEAVHDAVGGKQAGGAHAARADAAVIAASRAV